MQNLEAEILEIQNKLISVDDRRMNTVRNDLRNAFTSYSKGKKKQAAFSLIKASSGLLEFMDFGEEGRKLLNLSAMIEQ